MQQATSDADQKLEEQIDKMSEQTDWLGKLNIAQTNDIRLLRKRKGNNTK